MDPYPAAGLWRDRACGRCAGGGLAAAGHDVTLCAAPGSAVEGVRVIEPLDDLPVQIGMATDEWRHVLGALDALADVDVIVDHSGPLGALLSAQGPVPSMHVVHGSLEGELLGIYDGLQAVRRVCDSLPSAALSGWRRRTCRSPAYATTRSMSTPCRSEPYLAFLGRMAPEKGAAEAIVLAREAGRPRRDPGRAYPRAGFDAQPGRSVSALHGGPGSAQAPARRCAECRGR